MTVSKSVALDLNSIYMKLFVLALLFFIKCGLASAQPRPINTYLSKSVYFAKYYLKEKRAFAPFKEIKGGKDKYIFEFYNKFMVLKTSTASNTFTFKKKEIKYQDEVSFSAYDKLGKHFLIEVSSIKVGGHESNHINIFELDKDNAFKRLTMYVCRVL